MREAFLGIERVAVRWSRRLALAGGWLLLGLAIVTVLDVLLRKFFSRPIQGTFEASELLLALIIFLAMPYTGLSDGHVVLDLTTERLPRRIQHVIIGVNALFCAAFLGVVAWQVGLLAAEFSRTARTTITMRIPVYPFILPVTILTWLAAAGAIVQGLAALARALSGEPAPEARP